MIVFWYICPFSAWFPRWISQRPGTGDPFGILSTERLQFRDPFDADEAGAHHQHSGAPARFLPRVSPTNNGVYSKKMDISPGL